jgi:Right handed beta helix region
MSRNRMLFLVWVLLTTSLGLANTYYIDYRGGDDANPGSAKSSPWKKCPGMKGFQAAYTHAAGDVFVFKGGEVWPAEALPLSIVVSGSVDNPDRYAADKSWFSGNSWTQPTLDGQLGGKTLLFADMAEYFTLQDLRFINAGSLSANSVRGVEISNCGHIEIRDCVFALESWGGLYLWTSQPNVFSDYKIHHNDISKSAFGIRIVPSGANSIIRNVEIHNNVLHDFHSQLSGSVHGDGIQHYCSPDVAASSDRYIDGFRIYSNRFTGDFSQVEGSSGAMTALIYLSGSSKGVEIYNNLFAPSYSGQQSPNFFEAFISLRDNPNRGGSHKIYDNTFVTQVANGQAAAIIEDDPNHPSPQLDLKNNIFHGFQWPFDLRSPDHIIDYNNLTFTKNVGKWKGQWVETFRDWQALGNDVHGISADPLFVSPTDFHLSPRSPCVNRGLILDKSYAVDGDGVVRPQGSSFDLGAYETVDRPVQIIQPAISSRARVPVETGNHYDLNGRLNGHNSSNNFDRTPPNPPKRR